MGLSRYQINSDDMINSRFLNFKNIKTFHGAIKLFINVFISYFHGRTKGGGGGPVEKIFMRNFRIRISSLDKIMSIRMKRNYPPLVAECGL